jgi:predicted HNH restriction endonuclease
MKNYVAYHSVNKWGHYEPDEQLHFYSGKSADFLRASIGESVWVIVGTPDKGQTTYKLAGKYTPTKVRARKQGGHDILGTGKPFKPPIKLANLPWFSRLVREQGHFRFGFNLIKDKMVYEKLHGLIEQPNHPQRTGKLTVADYVKALGAIDGKISKLQWQMLLAHYSAVNRQMSARQLAAAVGISKFNVANLHYGKLGRLLCSALGKDSVADNVSSLVSMIPPGEDGNKEWLWTMRPEIAKALQQLGFVPSKIEIMDTELSAMEGAEKLALVRHRKREQSLRDAKVAEARKFGNGKLKCEVLKCSFDFEAVYGELGRDYAQVHHLKPLADRTKPSQTKLDDLAIVCANCHAMIHRGGKCRPLDKLIP